MAGTTFRNVKIEISTDNATWTDISGSTNALTVDGGEREVGTFFDAQNDTPTLGVGKRAELEIKVRVKYDETADSGFDKLGELYESGDPVYVRYSPKGGSTGQTRYTSGEGFVKTPPYPGGEVESGDPLRAEFSIAVPSITKSTIA